MKFFFDTLIYGSIFLTALIAVILLFHLTHDEKSWEHRHKKITLFFIISLIFSCFILIWGSFIEPKILVIKKQKIDLPNIDKPIKIAFITDTHIGAYNSDNFLDFIVKKIIDQKPDIVLIGGDLIDNTFNQDEINFLYPLKELTNLYPVYTVFGNHEHGIGKINGERIQLSNTIEDLKKYLDEINVNYLENDLYKIKTNGQNFYLFGADSFWADKTDYEILKKREENIDTIALIHNPASILEENYPTDFDLALFGHTHGGQIRLPFIGPIAKVDNVLSKYLYKGFLQDKNNNPIYVSSGLGETGVRARLFNPPEIIILEIY